MKTLRKYTQLDPEVIKKEYPKSFKKLKEWIYAPDKYQEDQMFEEKDMEKMTDFTLAFNPRMLFDFFDDQEVYITIDSEDGIFRHFNNKISYSESAPDRNEAEQKAFVYAFQELEKTLE